MITRGVEATSDEKVFGAFSEQFIKTGLIDERYAVVINHANRKDLDLLPGMKDRILELADAVINLYENMDDSLTFHGFDGNTRKNDQSTAHADNVMPVIDKDYRGVPCPLNFVKVKIDLSAMSEGETLKILLDDGEPIENVPRSVVEEGHEIVTQEKIENYWSVIIRKNG